MSELYPIFLNLQDQKCLVMGLGQTGLRKLAGLLQSTPACILALDLKPMHELAENAKQLLAPPVRFECRSWREKDLDGCFLAFACSNDREENKRLALACVKRNIPCNCASDPQAGTFFLGARVDAGCFQLAISSSGASPLLVASMKGELEKWLAKKTKLASFMGMLRDQVLHSSKDSGKNRQIFTRVLDSPVPEWLSQGECDLCREWLCKNISELSVDQIDCIFEKLKNELS